MNISMTREDLLSRLNEQLAEARAEDKRQAEKHERDEAAALVKFRAGLKRALAWNYHDAKKADSYSLRLRGPDCPRLESPHFENLIKSLKLDTRKGGFTLSQGSDLHAAVTWLPASKRPKQTVCD